MPTFEKDGVKIAYRDEGGGFPLFLVAPGGMKSAASFWKKAPFNPIKVFGDSFRVIAMDQRNAGESRGPVRSDHGWGTYVQDQLALIEHLGIEACLYLGMCIGGSYGLALLKARPNLFRAAVLLQPIGLDENRQAFFDMFDAWFDNLKVQRKDLDERAREGFKHNMYGGDFVFSVGEDDVRGCQTPLLVCKGNDLYHPESISKRIAELAPQADLIEEWKSPETRDAAVQRMREFLLQHSQPA
jgi:pimeloyl-ACP methyl ester carboxylesterase